jgi:hypothetical protein
MMGAKSYNPCKHLPKTTVNLTLPCEYIFPVINFITNKEEQFQTNGDVHSVNTRYKY